MNCFNHVTTPCVGICIACGKGVCPECAADLTRGLACKGICEHEARRLLDLRDFSFAQPGQQESILKHTRQTNIRLGMMLIFVAAGILALTWTSPKLSSLNILGMILGGFGLLLIVKARIPTTSAQFRLCNQCGYNITGNTSGTCPECGYDT